MNAVPIYIDLAIRQQAILERVKSGQTRAYIRDLEELEKIIMEAIVALYEEISDDSRTTSNTFLTE